MDTDPLISRGDLLLPPAMEGVVDHRGQPLSCRSTTGGWTAALFIIGVEIAERFAYYGVSSNLITYLTGPLGESTASAAANVNAWSGVASMLPLLGAFLADSYIGRYRTIILASLLYILGLGMLTLSAVAPTLRPPKCGSTTDREACAPTDFQACFFFFSVYLVAFAQGGHKPCVQAFGADQFDENDPEECKSKSSFFNWWYFGMCGGTIVTLLILNYVQENIGWGLGFGLPCIAMVIALGVFLVGTKVYRYYILTSRSPFAKIARACITFARSSRNRSSDSYERSLDIAEVEAKESPVSHTTNQCKALVGGTCSSQAKEDGVEYNVDQEEEEVKGVMRLIPIWATCLIYAVIFAQSSTFFTKQGSTMDRRIGRTFQVPPAALQSCISMSIVAFIPIYDCILVPVARKFSGKPSGITMLQRIGIGMFLSIFSMVIAALVEMKRLKTARDFGLVDLPKAVIPMSLWWLVPQYVLYGVADVFTMVGLQEFFYDQVPDRLRSLGLALYLSIFGLGSFLSSFLVSVIDKVSSGTGESWFSNNLNRAHLDYFYWLLAVLNAVGLIIYFYFAKSFLYKKKKGNITV